MAELAAKLAARTMPVMPRLTALTAKTKLFLRNQIILIFDFYERVLFYRQPRQPSFVFNNLRICVQIALPARRLVLPFKVVPLTPQAACNTGISQRIAGLLGRTAASF